MKHRLSDVSRPLGVVSRLATSAVQPVLRRYLEQIEEQSTLVCVATQAELPPNSASVAEGWNDGECQVPDFQCIDKCLQISKISDKRFRGRKF